MSDTPDPKSGVPRRVALKVLGSLPVAITAAPGLASAAPQAPPAPAVPGVPTPPPPAAAKGAYVPKFLSEDEWKTASALADMIIPRDERSGSATDARTVEYIDEYAAFWGSRVQPRLRGGLVWLDRECSLRFDKPFVDCTEEQRRQVLDLIAYPPKDEPSGRPEKEPPQTPTPKTGTAAGPSLVPVEEPETHATAYSAGIAFFTLFRNLTATGFFTSEIGIKDLGYMGNQPYDWKGCPPEVVEKLGLKRKA